MASPFWHTQQGQNSPLWSTAHRSPNCPDPPPSINRPRGTNTASSQRARVETKYHLPAPSSRPPIRSRYTSPQDETKPTASSSMLPRPSSASPGRVYSSPSGPYDRCRSPVMTLRILSPSRQGLRDERKQNDQENRPVQDSSEPASAPKGVSLIRSATSKLALPKRRRLPLRDSIQLKRKDSPGPSNSGSLTPANTPPKVPATPGRQTGPTWDSSTPPTPSKSRLIGVPRLEMFSRDRKPTTEAISEERLPEPTPRGQEEPGAERRQPVAQSEGSASHAGENLVSRICNLILDEKFGAGADKSSTSLKVWDAVARCLDDISVVSQTGHASQCQQVNISPGDAPPKTASGELSGSSSKNHWPPPRPWESLHNSNVDTGNQGRRASGYRKQGEIDASSALRQLASTAEDDTNSTSQTSSPDSTLPCPFRTRNPARFNVTDSWHCAKGQWKSLSELQQHIAKHHKHPSDAHLFQCPRCEKGFPEPAVFKEHLMLPREQMCDPQSEPSALTGDPEDGISAGRARMLSEGVELGKIGSWDDLWKCLFPADKTVPRPGEQARRRCYNKPQ